MRTPAFWLSLTASIACAYLGVGAVHIGMEDAAICFGLGFVAFLAFAAVVDACPIEGFAQAELGKRR